MYQIGIVGLDTVHSETLARVMWKYHDAAVSAVWDEGAVRDKEYLEQFCEKYSATAVDDLEDMVDRVDAAMILTKNPATHRRLASKFLNRGIPTLIDKPVVADIEDLEAIVESSKQGDATLFGGSAIPYHQDIQNFQKDVPNRTIHCVSYRGSLRYGHHVIDTARKVVGSDWVQVEPSTAPGESVSIEFSNGSYAIVRFDGPLSDAGFAFLDVSTRVDTTVIRSFSPTQPNADEQERDKIYRAYLDRFFGNIEGEYSDAPWIIDATSLLLSALTALERDTMIENQGWEMELVDLSEHITEMMDNHVAHY